MLWSRTTGAALLVTALALNNAAQADSRQEARLMTATQVLEELAATPDQNIPDWLLDRAYGVAVIPSVIKVGLGVGGRHGKGVLVVRRDDGSWSNPLFVSLTGGSFGFQIGVQSTDVVLVFMSRASIEGVAGGKVTLGADASVAAGPVGRSSSAATDIGLTAQVYSYSRSSGLFAGVALDGSAITIDHTSNGDFYQRSGVLPSDIIAAGAPRAPEPAPQFIAAVERSTGPAASTRISNSAEKDAPAAGAAAPAPASAQEGAITTYPMEDPEPGAEPPE